MFYTILSILIIFAGLIFAYLALRLLARRHWLLGFVRGLVGLGLLVLALMLALVSLDLFSYRQLTQEQAVATLSFKRLGEQYYETTLVRSSGEEEVFELRGDQWQLDARLIKWTGWVGGLGIHPAYRLDRLSGRYYRLNEERTAERTVYDLSSEHWGSERWGPDLWAWANRRPGWLPMVDTQYGSATFVPMADNALFEVRLSTTGLLARPLNEPARRALTVWE